MIDTWDFASRSLIEVNQGIAPASRDELTREVCPRKCVPVPGPKGAAPPSEPLEGLLLRAALPHRGMASTMTVEVRVLPCANFEIPPPPLVDTPRRSAPGWHNLPLALAIHIGTNGR